MKETGRTEILHLRVPVEVKQQLAELAEAERRSMTTQVQVLIERAYAEFLEQKSTKSPK